MKSITSGALEVTTTFVEGSLWRKWDLHIHTPLTKLNNQYSHTDDIWAEYCQILEMSDVDVFGITDYFSINNYSLFIKKYFSQTLN